MILFDFRYQDPWAEDTIVFPNCIEQTQAQQRHDQQADINRKTLHSRLQVIMGDYTRLQPNMQKVDYAKLSRKSLIYPFIFSFLLQPTMYD